VSKVCRALRDFLGRLGREAGGEGWVEISRGRRGGMRCGGGCALGNGVRRGRMGSGEKWVSGRGVGGRLRHLYGERRRMVMPRRVSGDDLWRVGENASESASVSGRCGRGHDLASGNANA